MIKTKNIALIEDDPAIRDAAKLILEKAGFEVTTFSSGSALLTETFKIPDLFILDKQLSGIDALDLCSYLKQQPNTANIPIIMISASPQVAQSAIAAGAAAFLEKPFRMQQLRVLVSSLV